MNIGQLRERVTIERNIRPSDGRGGRTQGFTPTKTVWAAVRAVSVRERANLQQVQGANLYVVTIRYRTDVTGDCRLVWRGRYLYPRGEPYDPDGKRAWLEIECEERKE